MTLVTLVSYCSLERAYIGELLRNAVTFSDVVVVSIGSRLYSGEPEDVTGLFRRDVLGCLDSGDEKNKKKVHLASYDVPASIPPDRHTSCLHNAARSAGYRAAKAIVGALNPNFWVLFLDGDEVPDGARFKQWLGSSEEFERGALGYNRVYKFANYWAFIHPKLVSVENEDSVLMAHSSMLCAGALGHRRERDGIYQWHWDLSSVAGALSKSDRLVLKRNVGSSVADSSDSSTPMFFHYSWVRGLPSISEVPDVIEPGWLGPAEAGINAKIDGWGHRGDRDWASVIAHTFREMRATNRWPSHEFVHGHSLRFLG